MKLSTLLKECKLISSISEKELNLDINSIHTTAQTVKQGGLYIAIKGFSADGHHFIDEAVKRGATVIVADKLNTINSTVQHQNIKHNTNTVLSKTETIDTKNTIINSPCTVIVENSRKTAGIIAAQFYNNPSDNMIIVGVTGTNGKTTISYIIENIFKKAGLKTGVIGTINYRYNNKIFSNPMTTPDSLELQRILSEMQKNHVTHVVMEVSSHAIDLYRINGTKFDVKVFTNLTQDHLDYHKTMEHYWDCKRQFLTDNLNCNNYHDKLSVTTNNKTHGDTTSCKDFHKTIKKPYIVINTDDQHGKMLFNDLSKSLALFTPNNSSNSEDLSKVTCKTERIISTGTTFNTNIKSVDIISDINGITGTIKTPLAVFKFQSQLTGKFNLENILNAVGVAHCLNISPDFIKTGIETFAGTPGRLEQIHNANDRFIFIDYAHTPDALSNVLTTIKSMAPKKVICIFGCGGDRDNAKRPLMGKIAQQYSDITIITSDNPRSENPDTIINHILKGINPKEYHQYNKEDIALGITQKGFIIEPDRKKAIELGIQLSSPDDTILIAGKGHETYQIIGDKTIAFDDKTEASEAIAKIPITWSAKDILKATSADHICGSLSVKFSGIAIDSRTISPDMFFVAIKGDTFNGYNFIYNAIDIGVAGILVSKTDLTNADILLLKNKNIFCVAVQDTTKALGALANFQRKRSNASVIAITGSSGKTTTKQMTASVFKTCFNTLATKGNLNNEIGLPLTLLQLAPAHKWAVVELGMNHAGEISNLADICEPDIGIITNVGTAHIEGLGSIKAIADAKGELVEKLKDGSTAILNGDDKWSEYIAEKINSNKTEFETNNKITTLYYGFSKDLPQQILHHNEKQKSLQHNVYEDFYINNYISATSINEHNQDNLLETTFKLNYQKKSIDITLKVPGLFMVSNGLAAASAGLKAGLTLQQIKKGLENFMPVAGRMNIIKSKEGYTIIDDTYNANPSSMKAAIKTLKSLAGEKRTILVIGDMLELGSQAESLHRSIGAFAAQQNISKLFCIGDYAWATAEEAIKKGFDKESVTTGSKEKIMPMLEQLIINKAMQKEGQEDGQKKGIEKEYNEKQNDHQKTESKDWILIKGSRKMAMESIIHYLIGNKE